MKAFILDKYAKGAALRQGELPDPVPHDTGVLVEVHAAGINPLDVKIRNGDFKLILPFKPPFALGSDVAGVVTKVGAKVTTFRRGDEVYARIDAKAIGTLAEFVVVNEADLAPEPASLSMEEAASAPLVALTAWQALFDRGHMTAGDKVFIQAGSGGVGTYAIQLAKHVGAHVTTTASASSAALLTALGADRLIDYRKEDFADALSDFDMVLHNQGAEELTKSIAILRPGGRLVSISGPPDPAFAEAIGANWLVRQVIRLLSFKARRTATRRGVDYNFLFMQASGAQLRQIGNLFDTGILRPVIDRVFPFSQTNEALAHVESGRAKGKVVVRVK